MKEKKDKNKKTLEEIENINEDNKKVEKKENIIELTKEEVEALNNKVIKLEEDLKNSNEESLRAKAELINYRKRKDEEVSRILKYSNEGIILEILPIIDNFERAINSCSEESNLLSGIKMIYTSLINLLNKFEVKEIDALDKPFDANLHQAVGTEESEGEKDIITEVYQKGYILKDKLLRPAMVKVRK